MTRWIKTLTALVAIASLVLVGCSKSKEEKAAEVATELAKQASEAAVDTAKEATEAAKQAADIADTAMEAAKDAEEVANMMGTSAAEAPEYMKKMVEHIKEINKLAKENMGTCAKAAEMINKYVEANKTELTEIQKKAQEATKAMSDQDKMKFGLQMQALMGPIMQETVQVQMQFAQKCQKEAKAVGQALGQFKMQ